MEHERLIAHNCSGYTEDNTLIKLPCKIGDIIYFLNWYKKPVRIEEFKVDHFTVCSDGINAECYDAKDMNDYTLYTVKEEDIILTKVEAEKKLEEQK